MLFPSLMKIVLFSHTGETYIGFFINLSLEQQVEFLNRGCPVGNNLVLLGVGPLVLVLFEFTLLLG